jgi:hypothetical protein
VFFQGWFREINRPDDKLGVTKWLRGQWCGSKEMLKVREHISLIKVANPDARVGTVGHRTIIQISNFWIEMLANRPGFMRFQPFRADTKAAQQIRCPGIRCSL